MPNKKTKKVTKSKKKTGKKSDKKNQEKIKLVLDTSIFVNPEIRKDFGKTPRDALENFVSLIKDIDWIQAYMAPSAWDELLTFIEETSPITEIKIIKRAPRIHESVVPLSLIYDFIDEMRSRINKGLRIVEKGVRSESSAENIRKFRNEYREALRHGIIDSIADLDTLILAREIDGIIVTMDEGLIKWAKKLGVPYVDARKLKQLLELLGE